LIEKVLSTVFFFSFILICPLSTLPVQLEERAIFPAILTFYTHNLLKLSVNNIQSRATIVALMPW
jgi:hypothetical protein